jgi:hypothetical protein
LPWKNLHDDLLSSSLAHYVTLFLALPLRKPKQEIKEEVCLCLFYLRQMPTFEVLGLHFGGAKTEANDTFHYWLGI